MNEGYVDESAGNVANKVSLVVAAILGIGCVGALLYFISMS
jgi:uncharacterized membrane protein